MMRIEHTERFTATVPALSKAWEFVLAHLERVGADPTVHIVPVYGSLMLDALDQPRPHVFEVVVEGTVSEHV